MTDPYQPAEKKFRITRSALQILLAHSNIPKKVGIFTRSPLVLQDLDLIKRLPKGRVHFTITPYSAEINRLIEPISPNTASRWNVIRKLKEAGIRVHVNVAPVMPVISEQFIDDWAKLLAILKVDEYFVDPMQCYAQSWDAFKQALQGKPFWQQVEDIMLNKQRYLDWKSEYLEKWNTARKKYEHLCPEQLPIWSDHENHVWIDMRSGQQMDKRCYNQDA
jgi:DNA repair photolyase